MNLHFNTEHSIFRFDPSLEGLVWYTVGAEFKFYDGRQVIAASIRSGYSPEVTLDKVQFGDGYEQVTESGINPVRDKFDIVFDKKPRAVTRALKRFFNGEPGMGTIYDRRPSEWFFWLPPYPYAEETDEPKRFRAEKLVITPDDYAFTTTVQFIQTFEP